MIDNGITYGDKNDPLFIAKDFIYVRKDYERR